MNAAPHATHKSRGFYWYAVVGDEMEDVYPYAVVCPDGTEHNRYNLRAVADQIADNLNAEDHTDRTMTDADRIAAIRANLDSYDEMRFPITEDEYRTVLKIIRDILS